MITDSDETLLICIHIAPSFPEEMMYCDEIAGIEPWQDHVILMINW